MLHFKHKAEKSNLKIKNQACILIEKEEENAHKENDTDFLQNFRNILETGYFNELLKNMNILHVCVLNEATINHRNREIELKYITLQLNKKKNQLDLQTFLLLRNIQGHK